MEISRKDVGNYHAHTVLVNNIYTVYASYSSKNGFARRIRKFGEKLDALDFLERWLSQDETKTHLGFIHQ